MTSFLPFSRLPSRRHAPHLLFSLPPPSFFFNLHLVNARLPSVLVHSSLACERLTHHTMRHLYYWSTIIPFALVLLALSPSAACACACASLLLTRPSTPAVLECAETAFFSSSHRQSSPSSPSQIVLPRDSSRSYLTPILSLHRLGCQSRRVRGILPSLRGDGRSASGSITSSLQISGTQADRS